METTKKTTSIRFSLVADSMLVALAEKLGLSKSAIIELAIRKLAENEGIAR